MEQRVVTTTTRSPVVVNKVLKNTYMLLAGTLGFAALMAVLSVNASVSPGVGLGCLIAGFVMGMFVLPRTAKSGAGILVIFAITGLLGFALGPTLQYYLATPNGPKVIATAFGGTAIIFLALSGYALMSKRDFSFMGGFLIAGMITAIVAIIANMFLQIPALSLAISAAIIMLMSGFILFDTSRIMRGGETNYIMATYGIFLSIFNIFIHLLSLLGALGDD